MSQDEKAVGKGRLGDDGTMDTVITCADCGYEERYTYDGEGGEKDYMLWVYQLIEEFDDEHMCEEAEEGEDNGE